VVYFVYRVYVVYVVYIGNPVFVKVKSVKGTAGF
jgi:hypothetical protein